MIYNLYINQKMAYDEKISINAVIIFDVLQKLFCFSEAIVENFEGKKYLKAYKDYILSNIPMFKINSRTLTTLIGELEGAGLIEIIDRNSFPGYTFTAKADGYIHSGNVQNIKNPTENKRKKKTYPLSLQRKTKLRDLTDNFVIELSKYCIAHAKKVLVDVEQFDVFMNYHASKGTEFLDWTSAFRNWCIKHKSFNKNANDGESENGLYR